MAEKDAQLFWCIEGLCDAKEFPRALFLDLINRLPPGTFSGPYPESLKFRMVVNGLKYCDELDMDTLNMLDSLTALVKQWQQQGPCPKNISPEDARILCPTLDLVLNVKTALVSDYWIKNPAVSSMEAMQHVHRVFGSGPTVPPAHQPRFEECLMAARQEEGREYINRIVSGASVVRQVQAYAENSLNILGKTAIRAVLDDIASGRYSVGFSTPDDRISDLAVVGSESSRNLAQSPQKTKKTLPADQHQALMEILNSMSPQQDGELKHKVESFMNLVQQQPDEDSPAKRADGLKVSSGAEMLRRPPKGSKRRPNRRWTDKEVQALKDGCLKHGVGHWSEILREYVDILHQRNQVDLKDKWRNMARHPDKDVARILAKEAAKKEEKERAENNKEGAP